MIHSRETCLGNVKWPRKSTNKDLYSKTGEKDLFGMDMLSYIENKTCDITKLPGG